MYKRLMGVASTLLVIALVSSGAVWGNSQANNTKPYVKDSVQQQDLNRSAPKVPVEKKETLKAKEKTQTVSKPTTVQKVETTKPVTNKQSESKRPNPESKCMYPMRQLNPDGSCNNEDPCNPENIKINGGKCD